MSRWPVQWTVALWCTAVFVFTLSAQVETAELFRYSVKRDKLPRDEQGELQVDATGLHYRSENGKNSTRIAFGDIHKADLSDRRVIRIETYDILKRKLTGRKVYVFRLIEGKFDEALTRFFVAHSKRLVIGNYAMSSAEPGGINAYHRHRLGGCHGKLLVAEDGIRFDTEHPKDSRTWRYADVETIGRMNAFHFRVSTMAETYNFDLKEELSEAVYENSVRQAYRLFPKANSTGKSD